MIKRASEAVTTTNIPSMRGKPLNKSLITEKRLCIDSIAKPMIRNSELLRRTKMHTPTQVIGLKKKT